ncbi:MAG: hypothetical protein ACRD0K_14570 [Egibacteraceae bacterium]
MSTTTRADQAHSIEQEYDPRRPYRDYSALELWESLEIQHSRGKYDEAMVWELALRACQLETLSGR